MRLINTSTLKLETYFGNQIPLYAILSHTWGPDEFLFDQLQRGIDAAQLANPSRGLAKVLKTCEQAEKDRLSAELSEAINSMFKWYEDSAACYIYLEDVAPGGLGSRVAEISASKWFTRGWTLQELIAPHGATFFDSDWNRLATRADVAAHIAQTTGIDKALLEREHDLLGRLSGSTSVLEKRRASSSCLYCGGKNHLQAKVDRYAVAARMRWAAHRDTTREEDIAYCLLGLFAINMPLLYGEGKEAFQRLQGEIVKRYPADQSILAWIEDDEATNETTGLFAKSPSDFYLEWSMLADQPLWRGDVKIAPTPRGVEIDVLLVHPREYLPPSEDFYNRPPQHVGQV
ncbi:hypothetical protein ACHAQH_005654 [Verticillium albo-atrum]